MVDLAGALDDYTSADPLVRSGARAILFPESPEEREARDHIISLLPPAVDIGRLKKLLEAIRQKSDSLREPDA